MSVAWNVDVGDLDAAAYADMHKRRYIKRGLPRGEPKRQRMDAAAAMMREKYQLEREQIWASNLTRNKN